MQIIPAIDVLEGRIVRLKQGEFQNSTDYGDNLVSVASSFEQQGAKSLHLVNLSGSRDGFIQEEFINSIRLISSKTGLKLQVGGGIRSISDIQKVLDAGVDKVVLGSLIFKNPEVVTSAVNMFGEGKIIAALDCRNEIICMEGWRKLTGIELEEALITIKILGIKQVLITDISRDGMQCGPNVDLYKRIKSKFPDIKLIASGGVRNSGDINKLKRICSSVVVGKALISKKTSFKDLSLSNSDLAIRIIPCLDIANGRAVKGIKFNNLKDAGNPVELAVRYCDEGADELVFLDIAATNENRKTMYKLVSEIADNINIPFTVGGGVGSVEDAGKLLDSGADKVSINSAAVTNPKLLSEISSRLGSANTVCAIDARKSGNSWKVLVCGGTKETNIDAIEWAKEAVERGVGELLVTSFDRDGTGEGFDNDLISKIKEQVNVPVIASGGAGSLNDFVDAVIQGEADSLLAASVFHYGKHSITDVKKALNNASLPVRL